MGVFDDVGCVEGVELGERWKGWGFEVVEKVGECGVEGFEVHVEG